MEMKGGNWFGLIVHKLPPYQKLSQNFSFWESNFRFMEKADRPLFQEPFTKATGPWE
jgi:hypothetical protein